jgi:peroxiredoxin Q/BCP
MEKVIKSVQVGEIAPDFTAQTQSQESVHLYSLLKSGQKVLLVFYPGDDTPGCTKQLCGIRDVYSEYAKLGVKVLGVNKAGFDSHQKFISKYQFPFDILVDEQNQIRDSYGAVKKFFNNLTVKRGVVLIDTDKKILYTFWGQQDNQKIIEILKNSH